MKPEKFYLTSKNAHDMGKQAWILVSKILATGASVVMTVGPYVLRRSDEHSSKMYAMLDDISEQVEWPVDGKMQYIDRYAWKDIFTAALKRENRIASGLEGGFVMIGSKTREFSVQEMSDVIELMYAFGSERGVKWSKV